MAKVNPPKGMRDVLPAAFCLRSRLIDTIRRVYESYGYSGMDTPAAEKLEYLQGKAGEEAEQLMFKIMKRGAKLTNSGDELADMGLRYDLTVSLCRYYATNRHLLPRIFRRYQVGPVWRADRPQHGRFREFRQCDIDIIGESSNYAEVEVILATQEVLHSLGLTKSVVRVSDRRLLPAIFETIGLDEEKTAKAMVSIDKLDKIGADGVLAECQGYLSEEESAGLGRLLADLRQDQELPFTAEALGEWGLKSSEKIEPILRNLECIRDTALEASERPFSIRFWPTLARGMGYYTGPVFEIFDDTQPFSLAGGGRYDGLVGKFFGQDIPACGFSIGFERLLTIMPEQDQPMKSQTQVLIALRDADLAVEGLQRAQELRKMGIPTEVYPMTKKMTKQFDHVETLGIPYLIAISKKGDAPQYEFIESASREKAVLPWNEILAKLSTPSG